MWLPESGDGDWTLVLAEFRRADSGTGKFSTIIDYLSVIREGRLLRLKNGWTRLSLGENSLRF